MQAPPALHGGSPYHGHLRQTLVEQTNTREPSEAGTAAGHPIYPNSVRTPPQMSYETNQPHAKQVAIPVEVSLPGDTVEQLPVPTVPEGPRFALDNLNEAFDKSVEPTESDERRGSKPFGGKEAWTESDWDEWAQFMATSNPMVGFSVDQWKKIGSMDKQ